MRKHGDKVRITAQLVNTNDGYHIFSETYDRQLEDIFDIQDEISNKIANKLREKLVESEAVAPEEKKPASNLNAYHLYLKGRYFCCKWKPEDARKAIALYEEAIQLEPEYALPYNGLADTYSFMGAMGVMPPEEAFRKAKEYAAKGLELDPDLAESHLALGSIHFWHEWDFKETHRSIQKAIELNPNLSDAWMFDAMYHLAMGETNLAVEKINTAMKLDPLSSKINLCLGASYMLQEQYEEALAQFDKCAELDPDSTDIVFKKCWTYGLMGDTKKSIELFESALDKIDLSKYNGIALGHIGHVYAKAGKMKEAESYLSKLKECEQNADSATLSYEYAIIYHGLNDVDKVFSYLEKGVDQRLGNMLFLKIDPIWKDLRSDARFKKLLMKIGLEG